MKYNDANQLSIVQQSFQQQIFNSPLMQYKCINMARKCNQIYCIRLVFQYNILLHFYNMQAQKPTDAQLMKVATEALGKLKQIEKNPKWEQFSDSPCLMLKMSVDERVMSRGETKVKIPIKKLYDWLGLENSLKFINPQLKQIKVLYNANVDGVEARVNYMRYAGIWPVEDRDLVNVAKKEEGADVCYIATQACTYPYEKQNKVTRAICHIGGWIIKKIDEQTSYAIYISDVDLAGSIPQMIKNQLAQKQASLPSRIEKAYEQYQKSANK